MQCSRCKTGGGLAQGLRKFRFFCVLSIQWNCARHIFKYVYISAQCATTFMCWRSGWGPREHASPPLPLFQPVKRIFDHSGYRPLCAITCTRQCPRPSRSCSLCHLRVPAQRNTSNDWQAKNSNVSVDGCLFEGCFAGNKGGGLSQDDGQLSVLSSVFYNNVALSDIEDDGEPNTRHYVGRVAMVVVTISAIVGAMPIQRNYDTSTLH